MVYQAEIHMMAKSNDVDERMGAMEVLKNNFAILKNKKQAWEDLHRLTQDKDDSVRWVANEALGAAYSHIPDEHKQQAWEDLMRLTQDKFVFTRWRAAEALGTAYSHIPDEHKQQAWEDLMRLIQDKFDPVRWRAADALGAAQSHIPDEHKQQAWDDLHRLTRDRDKYVRAVAYHSLGRASIFRATIADNEESYRKQMEKAIRYFKSSSHKGSFFKPAGFCLPFYRSFYSLTFKKGEAESEVRRYLSEAKSYVQGSESKKKLLEAIENLGNALKEAQNLRDKDFNTMKSDLNAYMRYCDRACELLNTTEKKAPGASRLIRKGLPIIDERIKGIIAEIQEKTKILCKQTKGTTFEDLGKNVYHIGQNLLVSNPAILEKRLNNLQISLSAICARTSDINVGEACDLLKRANNEPILENRIQLMDDAISKILPHIGNVTNIQISNSNNVQITTANGTTQKMSIEIPEEKTKK